MEVAAEVAPQGKRKKQTTEEDIAIETLDRKRKELREIQDKTKLQKIEYTELVKTVRKKRRQPEQKKLGRLKFINHEKKSRINILRLRERGQEFQLKLLNKRFECLSKKQV